MGMQAAALRADITIEQKDASDVEVKFNNLLSHRFSKSGIDQITKAANADLWRNNDIRAAELGRELFSVLDGTGGRLRSEIDNAGSLWSGSGKRSLWQCMEGWKPGICFRGLLSFLRSMM
ncbi:MAG: hypothetical protein GY749_11945 [Desulfobacteraceae bacterium]|nr:hypothetical protein [Desulfobacteraceae bacterium]